MKKALLIAVIIGGCFTSINCTKKGNDPTPPVVVVKTPTKTTNTKKDSVEYSITSSSGQLNLSAVSVDTSYQGTAFTTYVTGSGRSIKLNFSFNIKPTSSFSYTFGGTTTTNQAINVTQSSLGSSTAQSGVMNVEVSASKIIFSFTNVVFTSPDGSSETCSGYLSTYKWVQ